MQAVGNKILVHLGMQNDFQQVNLPPEIKEISTGARRAYRAGTCSATLLVVFRTIECDEGNGWGLMMGSCRACHFSFKIVSVRFHTSLLPMLDWVAAVRS
jgi:hypothetical protein